MGTFDPVVIKSFSKGVYFTGASATTMTLTDTAGTPIMCNYIQGVIASGATHTGYLLIVPSGTTNPSPYPVALLGNTGSGTLGAIGSVSRPVELNLGGADYCSSIQVSSSAATTVFINYGVRTTVNPMKSMSKNRGV